ncbi:hypothetical protein D1007_17735 [Hordeum vulgare]|nr:hypothetical protein D1007_17735 [Hordeum vulgare]
MLNWKSVEPQAIEEVDQLCTRLPQLTDLEGLTAVDLLTSLVAHRVHLLQHRPHLIRQMGGRRDPCRLSTKDLRAVHVARRLFPGCKSMVSG